MRQHFAPPNEDRRLQNEWANLKQYGTVFEYVSVLMALAMRIPGLSQTQILDKFIRGLKPKTRIEVELRDPKTSDEAYRLTDRLWRKEHQFSHTKLQPLCANIEREHECGLCGIYADRHVTTPPNRTKKLSTTSQSRTLLHVRKTRTYRSKLPRQTRTIQEEISTGKRATSVEDGNSTDEKDKAGSTIAALSTKELAKPEFGPRKHGRLNAGRRNNSAEDRKPARSKDTNHADGTGKGRKDTPVQKLEKRTLFASQTEEASESLCYPESEESTSADDVTQEETEQSMAKGCIETVDDENASDLDMRLGYFGLGLHDQMEVPEADKLLEVVGQIEGRPAKILLDTGCSTYVLSSRFAELNC